MGSVSSGFAECRWLYLIVASKLQLAKDHAGNLEGRGTQDVSQESSYEGLSQNSGPVEG